MSCQLVNTTCTLENAGQDQSLAKDLADVFVNSAEELINDLQTAWQTGDSESLARAAHTFKSPLGFFGAVDSMQLAQQIESSSDAGCSDGMGELIERLLVDVQRIREELRDLTF